MSGATLEARGVLRRLAEDVRARPGEDDEQARTLALGIISLLEELDGRDEDRQITRDYVKAMHDIEKELRLTVERLGAFRADDAKKAEVAQRERSKLEAAIANLVVFAKDLLDPASYDMVQRLLRGEVPTAHAP